MADKTVSLKLEVDAQGAGQSVSDLKKSIIDLKNQALKVGEDTPLGRQFIKDAGAAKDRLSDLNKQVDAFQDAGSKFGAVTKLVGSLAGGFQAAQGAAALFGASGEDLQKVLVKVQAATALAQGAQALAGITDEIGAVKKIALATASGIAGAAARLFGITTAQAMAVATAGLTVVIGAVVALISYFASAGDASEELAKKEDKRKDKAKKDGEYQTQLQQRDLDKAQLKIELLKKEGAAEEKIIQAQNELLDLKIKNNKAQQDLQDTTDEGQKKFDELQTEAKKLQNEKILLNTKEKKSVEELTTSGQPGSIAYYNDLLSQSNERLDKLVPGSAAYNAELTKQLNLTTQLEAAQANAFLEKQKRDGLTAPLVSATDSVEFPPEMQEELSFNDLMKQLELEQELSFQDNKTEIHKKAIEERKKLTKIDFAQSVQLAGQLTTALQGISDAVFANKLSKVKKGSAEEEKLMRKQFEFNKKMQLAGAIIDGAKAVIASLSQSPVAIGPIPNPAGIASLALVAVTTAASIAKIASTKFEGGGGGGVSVPSLNIGGEGLPGAPTLNQPTTDLTGTNQTNQPPSTQVYVTETDIKRVGSRVNVIEARARFG